MKQREVLWSPLWGTWRRLLRQGKPRRHRLTAGILVLVLVAQVGCASSGTDKRSASSLHFPVPRAAIQELGKVGVTSGRFVPTFDVDGPPKGTLRGAGRGLVGGFGIALITFGLGGGVILIRAIEGAVKAEPAVKVEEREAAAREIVAAQKIQDDLRDRMVAIGRSQTPHTFTVLADRGPSAAGEQPDYRPLSQEGIQTVLEVVAEGVTLKGPPLSIDPHLKLVMTMTVNTRLLRTVDNLEIHAKRLTYSGEKGQTLAEWVSDPEGFRNELNQAYTDIAERIVKEVFLGTESN